MKQQANPQLSSTGEVALAQYEQALRVQEDLTPDDEFTLGDVIISARIHELNISRHDEGESMNYDRRGGIHPLVSHIVDNLSHNENQLGDWNDPRSIGQERPNVDLQRQSIAGDDVWRNKVKASLNLHFGTVQNRTRLPRFKSGPIASSRYLIRYTLVLEQLLSVARTPLAVEMEAAGVYEAANQLAHQYPVMTIRGISDIVGLKRDHRWTNYACNTAAAFAHAFIMTDPLDPRGEIFSQLLAARL